MGSPSSSLIVGAGSGGTQTRRSVSDGGLGNMSPTGVHFSEINERKPNQETCAESADSAPGARQIAIKQASRYQAGESLSSKNVGPIDG